MGAGARQEADGQDEGGIGAYPQGPLQADPGADQGQEDEEGPGGQGGGEVEKGRQGPEFTRT